MRTYLFVYGGMYTYVYTYAIMYRLQHGGTQ